MTDHPGSHVRVRVDVVDGDTTTTRSDRVATEEPMEIRLLAGAERRTIAVTMRTPGNDFELAAGFLYSEGIVAAPDQIASITYCVDRDVDESQRFNIVNVALSTGRLPDLRTLERNFYTSSACGVCGKESLDALELRGGPASNDVRVDADLIRELPDKLRAAQGLFEKTGGLHAAAVFDATGGVIAAREDVGRHNAVDKVVGHALLDELLPLDGHLLMVSGRTSYEIMQKALAAGIPIVCGVSAPSSLAVDLATRFNMTLVGFLRGDRFNIYAGAERVA
ncbi:MAG: formate dehydrogenase accessory sulfurtransferase FdhD [Actinomycetota bacterium]